MEMKCPACGFEHDDKVDSSDSFLCVAWAYLYSLNKGYPTKEQFEAMQRERFLPTHGERDGRRWELTHGHYGWHVDYNWASIAARIFLAANVVKVG